MPRPKGSKNKSKAASLHEAYAITPHPRKGWPKGKKRGPRKDIHQLHLDAHAKMLKSMPKQYSDPKMDFKVLIVSIAKMIISFFKK
jgi:hypothetical protein